jgi:iron complex outermembrane recepter protein
VELSTTFNHRVPVDDRNTEEAPSHALVDLRTGFRELRAGQVTFAPWLAVTNVLDRSHVASVAVNAFGGRYYEPGPGRSFQVGLRAAF